MIRKEMIRAIIQLELNNIDIAENIVLNIESKHKELFQKKQFMLVKPFIIAMKLFINNPERLYLLKVLILFTLGSIFGLVFLFPAIPRKPRDGNRVVRRGGCKTSRTPHRGKNRWHN